MRELDPAMLRLLTRLHESRGHFVRAGDDPNATLPGLTAAYNARYVTIEGGRGWRDGDTYILTGTGLERIGKRKKRSLFSTWVNRHLNIAHASPQSRN